MEFRTPAVVGPPAPELTEDVRDLFVTDSSDITPFSHLFWPVFGTCRDGVPLANRDSSPELALPPLSWRLLFPCGPSVFSLLSSLSCSRLRLSLSTLSTLSREQGSGCLCRLSGEAMCVFKLSKKADMFGLLSGLAILTALWTVAVFRGLRILFWWKRSHGWGKTPKDVVVA